MGYEGKDYKMALRIEYQGDENLREWKLMGIWEHGTLVTGAEGEELGVRFAKLVYSNKLWKTGEGIRFKFVEILCSLPRWA
jgi:hypothetical protein